MGVGLARYQFKIDGKNIREPRNWADISLNLTFDENPQATVDVDDLEFVNTEAQTIQEILRGGLTGVTNGYFEGVSMQILATNDSDSLSVFDGYTNWKEVQINSPISVNLKIQKNDSINSLQDQAASNTFGFLEDIGAIGASDYAQIAYIVEKINPGVDIVVTSISLFVMSKELITAIRRLSKAIIEIAGIVSGGLVGVAYALIYTGLLILLELIYTVAIIIAIINLIKTLKELLFPKLRFMAGTKYRTLLEKAATRLGYVFKSDIPELDFVHYVPSKPFLETDVTSGIPRVNDFGYNFSDFFELVSDLFNARFAVVDNELHFRTDSDPFWVENSTFEFHQPEPLDEVKVFNNADIKSSILLSFTEDLSDEYTIINFKGTNFQVLTKLKNPKNPKFNLVQNSEQNIFPVALGNRKDELSFLEDLIKGLLGIVESFRIVIPTPESDEEQIPPPLTSIIEDRIGAIKISQPIFNVPKSVYLETINGKLRMPEDHRTKWKAKVLWDNFHNEKSFIQNGFRNQKQVFEQKEIPMGFEDVLKLDKNSFFKLKNGTFGKITSLKWFFNQDKAVIDYWVRTIFDTESLKEIFIEP